MFLPRLWNKYSLNRLSILAITVWVAHFFYYRDFGLYEDDYAFISPALGWELSDFLNHAKNVFANWPQGRPIGFTLPQLFSLIGAQLGGIHVIYLIAYIIITINAFLFYRLLKKITYESIAFSGAFAFCLFPADTTHLFLMHALGLQTSITFLLIACNSYLSGKRILPYVIIIGSLLTYESPFMVFLGIPLLRDKLKWDLSLRKELIRHGAILAGIILVYGLIRINMGETRVMEAGSNLWNTFATPLKIGAALFIGPAVSLGLFFYGPIYTLLHWNWQLSIVFIICLVFFTWVHRRLTFDDFKTGDDINFLALPNKFIRNREFIQIIEQYSELVKFLLAAGIMLCSAYLLSFTHFPPIARFGRQTSMQLAAAFGGSLIFVTVCSALVSVSKSNRVHNQRVFLISLYFSLLVTYRFSIQLDVKQAWHNQQNFWSCAVENLPDMTDGTVIFVSDHDLPQTRYLLTNSWADPVILRQVFNFPDDWKNPPRLFVVDRNWTDRLIREGDDFMWEVPMATWPKHWEYLPNSNVILLELEQGQLIRKFGSININGQEIKLKPMPDNTRLDFERGPLYRYLVDETGCQSFLHEDKDAIFLHGMQGNEIASVKSE